MTIFRRRDNASDQSRGALRNFTYLTIAFYESIAAHSGDYMCANYTDQGGLE
jgi:hypothetical protein